MDMLEGAHAPDSANAQALGAVFNDAIAEGRPLAILPGNLAALVRQAVSDALDAPRVPDLLRQIAERDHVINVLKGALAAAGVADPPLTSAHALGFTPQQAALVGALFAKYPRPVSSENLLRILPSRDHACERGLKLITVVVSHVRAKLPANSIIKDPLGYRLSDAFHATLKDLGP